MCKWEKVKLGDSLIEIIDGDRGKNYPNGQDFHENGYCLFLNTKNVPHTKFDFSSCSFISKEKDEMLRKGKLESGDIVMTTRGTVGNFAHYSTDCIYTHIRINSGMVIFRNTNEKIDNSFFNCLLSSSCIKNQINELLSGSAQPQLPIRDIKKIEIPLPPLEEQKRIAAILSSLDDKIEVNNQINKNLEEQAQAIYGDFFSKLNFPIGKMSDIVDVRDGTHDSPKFIQCGYPLVTSKNLTSFGVDICNTKNISEEDFKQINLRSKVDTYDILLSMIGTTGLVSLVIEKDINFAIKNVGLFKTSKSKHLIYYVYLYLTSTTTQQHIDMKLAGSTQKYISLGELRKLPIQIPSQKTLDGFNEKITPIFNIIIENIYTNKVLIGLRNALLPKLMNGEV